MNSRELVWRTLEFQSPERVPVVKGSLPWATERYPEFWAELQRKYPDDVVTCPRFAKKKMQAPDKVVVPGVSWDDWGVEFVTIDEGIHGEVRNPQVTDEDFEDTSAVHIPYEWLTVDVDQVNAYCRSTDRFVRAGDTYRPFEQLQFVRGTEQLMMDIAYRREGFIKFLKKVTDFYLESAYIWAKTDVDCLRLMDDWGSQRSLLINPADWRVLFKPFYAEVCKIAHDHGKKVFMHSDGYILDIYNDLVEIGVDGLNSQILLMSVDNLKKYAGKITFWGEIDRQHLLAHASPQEVADAVRTIKDNLWKDGGCIAQCEFGPGAKPENVAAVFDTWSGYRF